LSYFTTTKNQTKDTEPLAVHWGRWANGSFIWRKGMGRPVAMICPNYIKHVLPTHPRQQPTELKAARIKNKYMPPLLLTI
jgi:hypothetical protein